MMTRRTIVFLCMIGLVPMAAGADVGLETPFTFGFGARDLALGGANLANSDFTTAPYWNPARLVRAERYQLSLFHSRLYESDVAYQYVGIVAPTLDIGTFGIGVARLGVDGIERRDAGNVLLGHTDENRLALFVAYGREIRGYDIGLSLSMEHQSLDEYSATSTPGVSVSMGRRFGLPLGWARYADVALSGGNIVKPGLDLVNQTVEYPFRFDGGLTIRLAPSKQSQQTLSLSTRIGKPESGSAQWSYGLEYALWDQVYVRGGYRVDHLSAGLGVDVRPVRVDYAIVGRDLGTVHMFTLTTSFGLSRTERLNRREAHREAQFSELMVDRIRERNTQLIAELTRDGREFMNGQDYQSAYGLLDRALFLARGNALDTLDIHNLLTECNRQLRELTRQTDFARYLDSASTKLPNREFVATRYFAGLALELFPDHPEASGLFRTADSAIAQASLTQDIVETQLTVIDSLLSYGETEQAVTAAHALRQVAPSSERTRQAVRRAEFELFRNRASARYTASDFGGALAAIDSALQRYANHQWCLSLRDRIRQERHSTPAAATTQQPSTPKLTEQQTEQLEDLYRAAREDFAAGHLQNAVDKWEDIERQAPDFESVREYLVSAYRLIGIEYYGDNQLDQAIAVWKKAAVIDPNDEEIRTYIERTNSEIMKLKELSYGEQ